MSFTWSLPAEQTTLMSEEQSSFFVLLYQKYYERVFAYLYFRVSIRAIAEDLASQVFERAFLHRAELRTLEAAPAWIFQIARNSVADYFRQNRREVSLEALAGVEHPCVSSPEEGVLAEEERRVLLTLVSHLPEREREIVGLKFAGHLTNRQIARVMKLPEGTVGSVLYRTLGKLRDALGAEGEIR